MQQKCVSFYPVGFGGITLTLNFSFPCIKVIWCLCVLYKVKDLACFWTYMVLLYSEAFHGPEKTITSLGDLEITKISKPIKI